MTTITLKLGTLYGAYAAEFDLAAYGNCRDDDEPELDCPNCGRSFHSFSRLDDHMSEHEAVCRRCQKEPAGEEGLCYICRTYRH